MDSEGGLRKIIPYLLLLPLASALVLHAQQPAQEDRRQQADQFFKEGNELMAQSKPAEALLSFQKSLALEPKDTSVLYNGGLAAYLSNNFVVAADLWTRLKALDPDDWQARAKLVQTYQALGKTKERDAERAELIELWKSGASPQLTKQGFYCREQFEVNNTKIMVFEHFELKGDRAVRYVFNLMGPDGKAADHWYSLGSYEMTNSVWRETTKPKPKKGERLFHLDEYFRDGHATHGMMVGEPSYDEARAMVVNILEGKAKPQSSSTFETGPKKP